MDTRLRKHALGYWEIIDKPSAEELQKYYAEQYFQQGKGSYEIEYSEAELSYFRAKLEQRHAVLRRLGTGKGASAGTMLDVGCGEGYGLAFFREHGYVVTGLDFSSAGVTSKNAHCLDVLKTGNLFELLDAEIQTGKTYDVIWLQNVLEHVVDPLGLLESLRTLVAAGGVAVVTVPNDCSPIQRGAIDHRHIDHAFWVAPPDHLTYFDHASLINVASATGWTCLETLGDLPVDWFLFHPGSNYVRDKAVGKAAHYARVQIENLIHQQPIDDVIRFWSAAAKVGIGRGITAFLQLARKD